MVTISAMAEQKIKELIVEEKDSVGLRIYVKGGGSKMAMPNIGVGTSIGGVGVSTGRRGGG